MAPQAQRLCLYDQKPIKGRSDKKFCDDSCRNAYNTAQKNKKPFPFTPVITILKKNHAILEGLHRRGAEGYLLDKDEIYELGFDFRYCTGFVKYAGYDWYIHFGYVLMDHGRVYSILTKQSFDMELAFQHMEQQRQLSALQKKKK